YCKDVVICYDSDNAGQQATERAIDIFRSIGLNIKILTVPNGKDPDEFMKTYGDEGHSRFSYLLSKCGNDIEYRINKLRSKYNTDDTEQKVQFLTECAKLFASIENTIERDAYIQRLSDECLIERNAVYEQVQKYVNNNKTEEKKQYKREMQAISAKNDKIEAERAVNLRACNAEEALLSILLTNADASLNVCKTLTSDIFITPFNKKVYEKIKERAEKNLPTEAVDLSGDFSIDENSRISGFVYKHIKERDPFLAVKEYIEILEEESENQNFTPDRILMQDDEAIMEQIRKNMERKK
ncbi:MAG: toprim domain-containing protein, partial [Clostridia bacterium]|nr:toprim domain-containing protein [Clostridia bacterium]